MRTSSRLWRLLAMLMAFSLIAAACGDDDGDSADSTTTSAPDDGGDNGDNGDDGEEIDDEPIDVDFDTETLTIGTLLPETGQLSFLGPPMVEGIEMAIRDINEAGGVLGNDVRLVKGDDGSIDVSIAHATVDRLLGQEGVNAIIGAAGSGTTAQVVDKITSSGVVQCSPSNTAASLRNAGQDGYYFRTAPGDDLQAPTVAELVLADGHANVAVIVQATDYGRGFAEHIVAAIEDGGGSVVYNEAYDPNASNYTAEAQGIVAADPDAVVIVGYEEGVQVIQGLIEQGAPPADLPVYVADGMADEELGSSIDPSNPGIAFGIKGTQPSAAPEGGASWFPAAWEEFAPDINTIYSAQAYDCAVLIALAAQAAGTADPAQIRDHMGDVSGPEGTACETYAECLELLEAGESINYEGASGPIDFDESDPSTASYDVFTFNEDGEWEILEQILAQ